MRSHCGTRTFVVMVGTRITHVSVGGPTVITCMLTAMPIGLRLLHFWVKKLFSIAEKLKQVYCLHRWGHYKKKKKKNSGSKLLSDSQC